MNKEEKLNNLLNKVKETQDNIIEEAIEELSKELNKEEIEKAKEDLMFFNSGDWITREMEHSADILEEYIKQLEKKSDILDKVTDKLKEDIELAKKEYRITLNDRQDGIREEAQEILNIIEGEKK